MSFKLLMTLFSNRLVQYGALTFLLCLATFLVTRDYQIAVRKDAISAIELRHQKQINDARTKYEADLQSLNTKLAAANETITIKTRELNNELKRKATVTVDGINSGTIRLRDKHATSGCASAKTDDGTNSNSAAGQPDNGGNTGAELSRQTSQDLVRLATDAEQTNIALKACIQQYNTIREKFQE